MRENKLRKKLSNGEIVVGTAIDFKEPNIVEIIGYAGFDFVMIDMEHQARDLENLENMVRAAEFVDITPIIRIPEINEADALRALDMGGMGVVISHVRTKEDAVRAVSVVKYPPKGMRAIHSYTRATRYGSIPFAQHIKTANEQTHVWVIIEDAEGVKNIDEIVTVEGLDVVFPGPGDLSLDLGLPGEYNHPLFQDHLNKVIDATKKVKGLNLAQFITDPAQAKECFKKGCNILVFSYDSFLFTNLYKSYLIKIRDFLKE